MKRSTAGAAAVLTLTIGALLGLAAPASATASANARCMGEAISHGAVNGGPRAVAEHHRALKAMLEEDGLTLGQVWRTVASLETCE